MKVILKERVESLGDIGDIVYLDNFSIKEVLSTKQLTLQDTSNNSVSLPYAGTSHTAGIAMVDNGGTGTMMLNLDGEWAAHPNIVPDPTFDNPSEWTTNNVVIEDGVAKYAGVGTQYATSIGAVTQIGITYIFEFEVVEYTAGSIYISLEGEVSSTVSGLGVHSIELANTMSPDQQAHLISSDGFIGHIDNYTIREVGTEFPYNLELGTGILALGADYNELKRHNESGITEQKEKIDAGILAEIGAQIDGEQLQIDGEDLVISGG